MRDTSKKATLQLVDMECSYLTVDFFRKLPQDVDKGGNPTHSIFDRYNDSYLRRIGEFLVDTNASLAWHYKIIYIDHVDNGMKIYINPQLIFGILSFYQQEPRSCLMSIWSVQVCGTQFLSPSFIVKFVRPNEAYLIISSLKWVNWRWAQ